VDPLVLRRMSWFVGELDERVAFLERHAADLADVRVEVESVCLRIRERDDFDSEPASLRQVE
jgi:hypothetical protein